MIWKKKKDNPEAQAPEAAAAGKGPAAFWKKNWKLLVPAACVIVAGGAFLLWPKQAKPASVDASYTEAAPEYRNVSNTLSGTGTLNPANTYTVKSLVDGKDITPDEIYAHVNSGGGMCSTAAVSVLTVMMPPSIR